MTRDDIIRMAHEAEQPAETCWLAYEVEFLERFAALVAEHEHGSCARLLETYGLDLCLGDNDMQQYFERKKPARESYATAIRARSSNARKF